MARSPSEIEADIAALDEVRRKRMLGQVNARVGYEGVSTEKALPTIEEIAMEIARLKVELSQATGDSSGLGPVRPSFGSRP